MSEIWFEEQLLPETESIDRLIEGAKSPGERAKLESIRRKIRIHQPRWKTLSAESIRHLEVGNARMTYMLVRLGCDLDPEAEQRAVKTGFATVQFTAYLRGAQNLHPRVYAMEPSQVDRGKPGVV